VQQSCYQIEISPEFGSFSGAFLGTFDKNGKGLWYFKKIRKIWKLFGAFLTNFEIAQNFLCYFLCHFLKNSEFGRTPEFWEQVTALGD
jgi:hypothetical protein